MATSFRWMAWIGLGLSIALEPTSAWAHVHGGKAGDFMAGFSHPNSGLDHVVAMVAVGLWGAVLGPPAIWVLPVAFPMVMALGGLLGFMGIPIPGVEIGIAISAIVMGIMVMLEQKTALWFAALLVSVFAIFHGYAHGSELPAGSNALQYSLGFVIATGLLHLIGILLAETRRWPKGQALIQTAGAAITITGLYFLFLGLQ